MPPSLPRYDAIYRMPRCVELFGQPVDRYGRWIVAFSYFQHLFFGEPCITVIDTTGHAFWMDDGRIANMPLWHSPFVTSIHHVFQGRAKKQMTRITTRGTIAVMANILRVIHKPVGQKERHAVCHKHTPTTLYSGNGKNTIKPSGFPSQIRPAFLSVANFYHRPEVCCLHCCEWRNGLTHALTLYNGETA